MSRLIDADALRAAVMKILNNSIGGEYDGVYQCLEAINNAPTVCNDNYSMGYQDGVKTVLSERPQGKWIPVSERLPHAEYGESDTVLVSACWISDKDLKDKAIFVTEAYFDGSCFRRPTGEVYWNIKVIAWQPLPEPYKEAENE